jgi:hypothetical protein
MNIRRGFWTSYPGLAVRLTFWAACGLIWGVIVGLATPFYSVWFMVRSDIREFRREREQEETRAMLRRGRESVSDRFAILIRDIFTPEEDTGAPVRSKVAVDSWEAEGNC